MDTWDPPFPISLYLLTNTFDIWQYVQQTFKIMLFLWNPKKYQSSGRRDWEYHFVHSYRSLYNVGARRSFVPLYLPPVTQSKIQPQWRETSWPSSGSNLGCYVRRFQNTGCEWARRKGWKCAKLFRFYELFLEMSLWKTQFFIPRCDICASFSHLISQTFHAA